MADGPRGPDGIAVVDKPAGWTSHDVVARSRKVLGTRKVGHSGTLDPDATGVLVLGIGRATRLLRFLTLLPKRYTATIVLGTETTTLDAAGDVTAVHDMSGVVPDDVRDAARRLTGHIEQVPPMFSAVKVDGRRLHEIAREGGEVERAPRPVTVHRFDVVPTGDPLVWEVDVECSSGTYVRTLAADLGTSLGGGAHLTDLRRLSVGSFTLDEARSMESPELLPPAAGVRHLAGVVVGDELATDIGHGKVLDRERLGIEGGGPWAVHGADGTLLAVYEPYGDRTKPAVVLVG
ncbi:MAG: tRNA pseudouridine(55) synthase TruB [Actinobacteria bacterium]|nr:tRNA pseudouridine(55) synthase TruB [Actinomycetota bacterium]